MRYSSLTMTGGLHVLAFLDIDMVREVDTSGPPAAADLSADHGCSRTQP
jgi:hypothetical protein